MGLADRTKKYGKEAAEAQLRLELVPKVSRASRGGAESGAKTAAGLSRAAR